MRYSTFSVGDCVNLGGRKINILPANHVRNLQVNIVRARRQMVRRHAIAAQQREVFHIGRQLRLRPKHFIFKRNFLRRVPLHPVANHKRFARRRSVPPVRVPSHPGVADLATGCHISW